MFDDINLSERERDRDGDALILELFRQWQAAYPRGEGEWPADEDEFGAVRDRICELEERIRTTAASGAIGLAIKTFLMIRAEDHRPRDGDPCGIGGFCENDYNEAGRLYND